MRRQKRDLGTVLFGSSPGSALGLYRADNLRLRPHALSALSGWSILYGRNTCRSGLVKLYGHEALAQMAPMGLHVEPIKNLAADDLAIIAIGASLYVSSGRVRICSQAMAHLESYRIATGIADADDGDALRLSFVIAATLCLNPNQTLTT
jgi:hypothetical protein